MLALLYINDNDLFNARSVYAGILNFVLIVVNEYKKFVKD